MLTLQADTDTGARMCVGESGWLDVETCVAEIYVIKRRAAMSGRSFSEQARAYSAVFKTGLRPWIVELEDVPHPPPSWPDGPSWSRHRRLLKRLLHHVRHALIGDEPDPCPGAVHFGSRRLDRPAYTRHVEARCLPASGQVFYVPGRPARRRQPLRLYERVTVTS